MSGIWKKLFLVVGVGALILIGSSVGSAVVTQPGIVSAVVPDSLEWRGFYSPPNPATLQGGFHWWPISISYQATQSRGPRPLDGFLGNNDEWRRQQELDSLRQDFEWKREEDKWQRQQELDGLRQDLEWQRQEDQWQERQRDFYRSYP